MVVLVYTMFGQPSTIEKPKVNMSTASTTVFQSELEMQILKGIHEILTKQRQNQRNGGTTDWPGSGER